MKKILFFILSIPLLSGCFLNEKEELTNHIFSKDMFEPTIYNGISNDYYRPIFNEEFENSSAINRLEVLTGRPYLRNMVVRDNALVIEQNSPELLLLKIKGSLIRIQEETNFEFCIKFRGTNLNMASVGVFFGYINDAYSFCCIRDGGRIILATKRETDSPNNAIIKKDGLVGNLNTTPEEWNELVVRKTKGVFNVFVNGKNVLKTNDVPRYGEEVGLYLQNANVLIDCITFKEIGLPFKSIK
ncbi:hypothetical protein [Capnocytophaga bilenii]|uniref:hypothetical protein n=1 Tax=Capnocytophaga bilenii TaxID=2819369 RepID=UPI0028D1408D|nr:hypothetical protein [Capnocytophaga bilenii]